AEVFADTDRLKRLPGHVALGHVRHAGDCADRAVNAQPLVIRYRHGSLAIAHNGNLTNGHRLREELETEGSIFQTTTDSEIIAHLVARCGEKELTTALKKSLPKVQGAYAFVLMSPDQLIGLRDPHGIRPLSLGKMPSGYVLASETCAFDTIGAEFVRDIAPGEMVTIDRHGLHFERFAPPAPRAMCIFEFIYFARPDSNLLGRNVHLVRKRLGRRLAAEHPVAADLV